MKKKTLNLLKRYWYILFGLISLLTLAYISGHRPIENAQSAPTPSLVEGFALSDYPNITADNRLNLPYTGFSGEKGIYSRPMEEYLDKLRDMESCSEQGTPDMGSPSFGAYCYKTGTYLLFVRKYKLLPNMEDGELINNLSDYRTQRELTRLILAYEPNGARNWYTSIFVRGLGLPPL